MEKKIQDGTNRIRSRSIGFTVHHFNPYTTQDFADNKWFDLNIYSNNPNPNRNPNPYFVYESLICQRQLGGWK